MAKPVEYVARIRRGGNEVESLRLVPGCEAVYVGRSRECALCTPADDMLVSGRHARIYWNGRSLFVEEDVNCKNGVFYRQRRLDKRCLVKPGMSFSIGSCTLDFEAPVSARKAAVPAFHKLEFINGNRAGEQVEIRPKEGESVFTIGQDPDNSLVLPQEHVSRHHAYMELKENGECWLHDGDSQGHSRNGTYVNGKKLGGKERLLKDNDKISIVYFEFRFLDRAKRHKRLFLWMKVFAVAVTLCAMAGIYLAIVGLDRAEKYLSEAKNAYSKGDFDQASNVLQRATLARDAPEYGKQIANLAQRISVWNTTVKTWSGVKRDFANGDFKATKKKLDLLKKIDTDAEGKPIDPWGWNGKTAVDEKEEFEFADRALCAVDEAKDALDKMEDGNPEEQAALMRSAEEKLKTFQETNQNRLEKHDYLLTYVTNHLEKTLRQLAFARAGFESVDEPIAKLDGINPDFAALAVRLDTIARDARQNGSVRAYAEKYKQPCMELAAAKQFISAEFDDINAMRFSEVRSRKDQLQLPRVELCQRHAQLSEHRKKLDGHHQDAQRLAHNLESLVNGLAEFGVVNGNCGLPIQHVLNEDSWKQVLTFPCLQEKPPSARRTRPTGFYDELLGVDYTFQSIRALPNAYDGFCLRMVGFSPDCVEARHAFENVESFVEFMQKSPRWLRRGDLGAFFDYCQQLLTQRDTIIAMLAARSGSARERLVAGFYADFLSPKANSERRKELALEFRNLQKRVTDLCEKYEDAHDPIEQISIRSQILSLALPGDPQIHARWVQMYDGRVK